MEHGFPWIQMSSDTTVVNEISRWLNAAAFGPVPGNSEMTPDPGHEEKIRNAL